MSAPGAASARSEPDLEAGGGPAPPAVRIVIEPPGAWQGLGLGELWAHRELLYFFAWRDVKVRYKQTVLGAAWAVLQPVLTMVIFSVVFGRLAGLPSDGHPYPVFAFCALLPWQLFATSLTQASTSLVGQQHLIKKVYFPRLAVPLAAVLAGLVDFLVAALVLLAIMGWYGLRPGPAVVALPLFVLLALGAAIGVGLWLCALTVQYRDFRYTLPFLAQAWMFATPIAYPASLVPAGWRTLYGLNPLVGVVEGFRWALLGGEAPAAGMLLASSASVVVALLGGLLFFRRMERRFADLA